MPYRISSEDARRRELRQPGWLRLQLPEELGECHTDTLCIAPDFSLLRTHYRPRRNLAEESRKELERPVLAITFALAGESRFRGRCGTEIPFRSGHTTVSTFRSTCGERHYRMDEGVEQLRLVVSEDLLCRYLGEEAAHRLLDGRGGVRQLAHRPTSRASLAHAGTLLWHADQAPTDLLQTHIRVLSLLAEELRHLELPGPQREPRFRQRDAEKIDEARRMLEGRPGRSLTVGELAGAVGLNESKLREGFRGRFNKSPQRLQLELRMEKARQLLETGCQVAEAAYAVGYEHPSNFSAAFTRYFGRPPKTVFGPKR